MAITKGTANNKNKFRKQGTPTQTSMGDEKNIRKSLDFSDGKLSVTLTIIQLITTIIFIGGIVWFIAANWVFDSKCNRVINDKIKDLEGKMSEFKSTNDCLKIKGVFSKECYK